VKNSSTERQEAQLSLA